MARFTFWRHLRAKAWAFGGSALNYECYTYFLFPFATLTIGLPIKPVILPCLEVVAYDMALVVDAVDLGIVRPWVFN